ncbi:hypothetical protein DSM104443_03612 [Usitatibacter rugosus]|uniref:DUF3597 domain-containing protein n=1 Tax=Usitatibacter rugosus TaxID=2732067 RepID=A0A6M4GZ55_9PROT|nr:DUF3597 domain-containing protein [Usitatibacter rugosus]QJR12526.1 hypothetical protein DSM104443_03612 [Usitatibacter rugosus]
MSFFSKILDKLRGHSSAPTSGSSTTAPMPPAAPTAAPASAAPLSDVDVEAVLAQMAAKKGGGGNYKTSIVDLLKMLDLDSSLDARKQLATELNVNAGAPGTAEQNIALQKAVMRELAKNGGKVPASLRD